MKYENFLDINSSDFQIRLISLLDETITQAEIAEKLDTSRQNVGNWIKGKTTPDIFMLSKMADMLHVSTDYLLCRTDTKTPDTSLQGACKYTGLSEKAVRNIANRHIYGDQTEPAETFDVLNKMLKSFDFINLINTINRNVKSQALWANTMERNKSVDKIDEFTFAKEEKDKSMAFVIYQINKVTEKIIDSLVEDYISQHNANKARSEK